MYMYVHTFHMCMHIHRHIYVDSSIFACINKRLANIISGYMHMHIYNVHPYAHLYDCVGVKVCE